MTKPSTMVNKICSISFRATEMEVRGAMCSLKQTLEEANVAPSSVDDAQIVLAEICNNVVEHAYASHTAGDVSVNIYASEGKLSCRVQDHGAAMPDEQLPLGKAVDTRAEIAQLPEGGYGWMLIHSLTENITYERTEGANMLSFDLPIKGTVLA